MNRRICRAKDIETEKWVYGFYAHIRDALRGKESHRIYTGNAEYDCGDLYEEFHEVDPDTVCIGTGMNDKRGNEIFESDYVAIDDDVKEIFRVKDGVVKYGRGGFYVNEFSLLNSLNSIADLNCVFRGEVVGNCFDNPELLQMEG